MFTCPFYLFVNAQEYGQIYNICQIIFVQFFNEIHVSWKHVGFKIFGSFLSIVFALACLPFPLFLSSPFVFFFMVRFYANVASRCIISSRQLHVDNLQLLWRHALCTATLRWTTILPNGPMKAKVCFSHRSVDFPFRIWIELTWK